MAEQTGGIPAPQRRVGPYEIIRQIGRGGMATVYLARQTTLDRNIALKELSVFHASSPEMAARFVRESRLAGSLNHPNVVTVLEYFDEGGTPFIAMEYVPRGSLRPYVGRLHLAQFAGVMEGILAGLTHASTFGIVHRDLKPENLMVTSDGRVKIADFGIAKATETAGTSGFVTATGMTIGTPRYMSPEQVMGGEIGIWSDLYSVGVIAHEQAVGRPPFADTDSPMAILVRQVNEAIPPAVELNASLDPELSAWIDRLLVKDPSRRTRNPAQAWEQLEEIVVRLMGPLWRRHARLPEHAAALDPPQPLTPAPFAVPPPRSPPPAPVELSRKDTVTRVHTIQEPAEPSGSSAPGTDSTGHQEMRAEASQPAPVDGRGRIRWLGRHSRGGTHRAIARASLYRRMAVAAMAAAGGFLVAPGLRAQPVKRAIHPEAAAAGPLSVTIPTGWHRQTVPTIRGVSFAHAVAIGTSHRVAGTLIIGLSGSSDQYKLPTGLSSAVSGAATPQLVAGGGGEFYRYGRVRIPGIDGSDTVYASATTDGLLIAICNSRAASSDFTNACANVLSTVKLRSGKSLILAPRSDYVSALRRMIGTLNGVRTSGGLAFSHAKRGSDQAAAAGVIAAAYYRASGQVRSLRAGASTVRLNTAIANGMRGIADGYTAIGRAARKGDGAGYGKARVTVQMESDALNHLLREVSRSVYVSA